ncbi:hypothetical protein A2U01_0115698, partial [Trifolium medium]|nr:hypothetical protein [Trifolium medium]
MKEEGVIITRDDIVQVSPLKERKDSPDPETVTTEPVNSEVVSSPESIEIPSEKPTSEQPI